MLVESYTVNFEDINEFLEVSTEFEEFISKCKDSKVIINLKPNESQNHYCLIKVGEENRMPVFLSKLISQAHQPSEPAKQELSGDELNQVENEVDQVYNYYLQQYSKEQAQFSIFQVIQSIQNHLSNSIAKLTTKYLTDVGSLSESILEIDMKEHSVEKLEFGVDIGFHSGEELCKIPSVSTDTGNFDWKLKNKIIA